MNSNNEQVKTNKMNRLWLILSIVFVFILGILAANILERRTEATLVSTPKIALDEFESDNSKWGENYPREYQSYMKTQDTTFKSKYNGNAMIDMLEVDPRMVVLWAGYAFSKDYNQGRGHSYAIEDIQNSLRTGGPIEGRPGALPNTCWTCKSPDVPRVMNELIKEKGSTEAGIAAFYSGKWESRGTQIQHDIGCADCHDSKTMNLKITRPALIEAYQRNGKDITKATHQEMRSLVCAQCHVEYYFDKKRVEGSPYLTLPWDKGMTVEAMEQYYDQIEFSDWTHALSKTPMLKAQHPDYELYTMGVHADRGVSCADCHMPYTSEGGQKFTDHHLQSPLNNVANSCQVCHRQETAKLISNVYERQDKIIENRNQLEILLVRAHVEAAKAWELGATEAQMKAIQLDIRHAQWRWDYSAAGHGSSFHAPVEISRVIATGINIAQEARIKLSRLLIELGFKGEVPYPDINTKEKAQKFIGLPMDQLKKEKEEFKQQTLPAWVIQGN
jgi:nitrite reductase (cytochrome c-552)